MAQRKWSSQCMVWSSICRRDIWFILHIVFSTCLWARGHPRPCALTHIVCTLNVIQMEWNALSFVENLRRTSANAKAAVWCVARAHFIESDLRKLFSVVVARIIIKYLCSVWNLYFVDLNASLCLANNSTNTQTFAYLCLLLSFLFDCLKIYDGCIILQFGLSILRLNANVYCILMIDGNNSGKRKSHFKYPFMEMKSIFALNRINATHSSVVISFCLAIILSKRPKLHTFHGSSFHRRNITAEKLHFKHWDMFCANIAIENEICSLKSEKDSKKRSNPKCCRQLYEMESTS